MYDEDDWDLDDGPDLDPDWDPDAEPDDDDWFSHPSLTAAERNPSLARYC